MGPGKRVWSKRERRDRLAGPARFLWATRRSAPRLAHARAAVLRSSNRQDQGCLGRYFVVGPLATGDQELAMASATFHVERRVCRLCQANQAEPGTSPSPSQQARIGLAPSALDGGVVGPQGMDLVNWQIAGGIWGPARASRPVMFVAMPLLRGWRRSLVWEAIFCRVESIARPWGPKVVCAGAVCGQLWGGSHSAGYMWAVAYPEPKADRPPRVMMA